MGFICHVEHPHKFILLYLQNLDASRELMQEAWSLANDRYVCNMSTDTPLSFLFKVHFLFPVRETCTCLLVWRVGVFSVVRPHRAVSTYLMNDSFLLEGKVWRFCFISVSYAFPMKITDAFAFMQERD
jgi:hypothetical protein